VSHADGDHSGGSERSLVYRNCRQRALIAVEAADTADRLGAGRAGQKREQTAGGNSDGLVDWSWNFWRSDRAKRVTVASLRAAHS